LNEEVSQCDIFLAIIGPKWVNITDDNGNRRLEKPDDFVRIENHETLLVGAGRALANGTLSEP